MSEFDLKSVSAVYAKHCMRAVEFASDRDLVGALAALEDGRLYCVAEIERAFPDEKERAEGIVLFLEGHHASERMIRLKAAGIDPTERARQEIKRMYAVASADGETDRLDIVSTAARAAAAESDKKRGRG